MAITKDTPRTYDPAIPPMFLDMPGKVSTTFYEGWYLTDAAGAGEAGPLTASENFVGVCERGVITNATTSDINVKVRQQGILKDVAITGVTGDTNYGVAVYASDNGTLTLTSSTTFVQIGKFLSYKGVSGYGDVFFQAATVRSI